MHRLVQGLAGVGRGGMGGGAGFRPELVVLGREAGRKDDGGWIDDWLWVVRDERVYGTTGARHGRLALGGLKYR